MISQIKHAAAQQHQDSAQRRLIRAKRDGELAPGGAGGGLPAAGRSGEANRGIGRSRRDWRRRQRYKEADGKSRCTLTTAEAPPPAAVATHSSSPARNVQMVRSGWLGARRTGGVGGTGSGADASGGGGFGGGGEHPARNGTGAEGAKMILPP